MKLAQRPREMAKTMRIGLVWLTTNKGIVGHNSQTGGYTSFLGFTADARRAVVILTNRVTELDDLGFATLDANAPLAPVVPSAMLDDYVGTYKLADKFLLKTFRVNDVLFVQATGQVAIPVFPSTPTEFFNKIVGFSISFRRDSNGAVNELVLHQNGDRAAPKLSASELPPEPQEIDLDAATLGEYVGKYRLSAAAVVDFTLKGDHLEGSQASPSLRAPRTSSFLRLLRPSSTSSAARAERWSRWFCTKTDAISEHPGWRLNDDIGSMKVVVTLALKYVGSTSGVPEIAADLSRRPTRQPWATSGHLAMFDACCTFSRPQPL